MIDTSESSFATAAVDSGVHRCESTGFHMRRILLLPTSGDISCVRSKRAVGTVLRSIRCIIGLPL